MSRARARELAKTFLERGDAKGWFEALYAEAKGVAERIPWADLEPNPHLISWLNENDARGEGRRALVVGCGLGDDAETLAARGFDVIAFDISAAAIDWGKRRYPDSKVDYVAADLFELPSEWRGAFHLVVEVNTLQVLPSELRPDAIYAMVNCVTPGGSLLVIARGRAPNDHPGSMPWPLTVSDLEPFAQSGLNLVSFDDFIDQEDPRSDDSGFNTANQSRESHEDKHLVAITGCRNAFYRGVGSNQNSRQSTDQSRKSRRLATALRRQDLRRLARFSQR